MDAISGSRHIRVLLVSMGMPGMLRDIVEDVLRSQSDMDIVGVLAGLTRWEELARGGPSDIVIVGLADGELPEPCKSFVKLAPSNKVLGITADGKRSILCVLAPKTIELGQLSLQELADAIRTATQEVPA